MRKSSPSKVLYPKESRGGGGSPLDFGLKVSGYHGEFGKKIKNFAPGVQHCVSTENVKKRRSRHLYKGEYGKVPKMTVFGNFAPVNVKTEKKK